MRVILTSTALIITHFERLGSTQIQVSGPYDTFQCMVEFDIIKLTSLLLEIHRKRTKMRYAICQME